MKAKFFVAIYRLIQYQPYYDKFRKYRKYIMKTMAKIKTQLLSTFLVAGFISCSQQTEMPNSPLSLDVLWNTPGFNSPESVLLSGDTSFLYVSNVGGEGDVHDGNGYISKLAKDGKVITEKWATGIDAPKGMALHDDKLYVTDIDKLIEIDVATGAILQSIPVPEAKFLNDIAYVPSLGVLFSDSGSRSLYLYDGDEMSRWLQDDLLKGVNGLHFDGKNVLVVTMSDGHLLSLDPNSKALDIIASGIKNADGIKVLQDGSYFVSGWPGQLYHVSKSGITTLLQDTSEEEILMNDFELEGNIIYMANYKPGTVQAIKLTLSHVR